MDRDYSIKGAREMERLLKELGPKTANRVGDQALRAAAKPVVEAAKRLVAVDTGQMQESISSWVDRKASDGERVILIGVLRPVSRRFHLLELGTKFMPARPFLRPSLDAQASHALSEMGRVLARGIEREAKKLARK